ncbi:carbohydrate sulfotransferase 9-like isoform X2 [Haliotis rubra]|uniref:carbohydrate sulfotransferase 9-like isoform X2 n=1 Tax=Haliotis rubra TaxID=36100 RepID=UPI001EE5C6C4|nr:carbohydrate sulfotransferase 9-like isoform X2 [Haliotis rubra]XP_046576389.1 carbohydrate sulfotransferase 9-like isoform X2 [Haliotis rubra]
MISRKRQVLYIMVVVSAVSFFYNSNHVFSEYDHVLGKYHSPHSVAPYSLVQSLQLTLQLPRNTTSRKVIVQSYIKNLQSQLVGRVQQQYQTLPFQGLEKMYRSRRKLVRDICRVRRSGKMKADKLQRQISVLKNPNLFYCAVPKAGSTFWRRVFVAAKRRKSGLSSPYLYSYSDFITNNYALDIKLTKSNRKKDLQKTLKSTFKFLFTRDPYHRLFSTYIDKMFAPNSVFWEYTAKRAIKKVRTDGRFYTGCGADIKFVELVRYLNTLHPNNYNEHLIPTTGKCDVCSVDYDVIGKMETFTNDAMYILNRTGLLGKQIVFYDMRTEHEVDYIIDAVVRGFRLKHVKRSAWINCVSSHAGYQRIWRQLQIAGLIDKTRQYPLTSLGSETISVTEYINMALEAYRLSSPLSILNKKEAYLQAYSQLSLRDLEAIREKYLDDFYTFGYPDRPPELFHRASIPQQNMFDYFDLL